MIPTENNSEIPVDLKDVTDEDSFFKLCRGEAQDKFYECEGCPFENYPRTREQEILKDGTDILIVVDKPSSEDIPFPSSNGEDIGYAFKGKKWWGLKNFIRKNSLRGSKVTRFALTTAVMCYDKKNRTKDYPIKAVRQCGNVLRRKIYYSGAKVVLLMGRQACKASPVAALQKITSIDSVRGEIFKQKVGTNTVFFIPTHGLRDVITFPDMWSTLIHDLEKSMDIFNKGFFKPSISKLTFKYLYPETTEEIRAVLEPLTDQPDKIVAFDIETTGLNSRAPDAKVTVVSFSWAPREACSIHMDSCNKESKKLIEKFLTSTTKKIAHNAQFDIEYILNCWDLEVKNLYADTMLVHYMLDENRSGGEERTLKGEFTLKKLVWDFLPQYGGYEREGDVSSYFKKGLGDQIPKDILLKYAAIDADVTLQIYFKQLRKMYGVSLTSTKEDLIKEMNSPFKNGERVLHTLATEFMSRATEAVVHMKSSGMCISEDKLKKLCSEIPEKLETLQEHVRKVSGKEDISLSNNKDIAWILHDHLKLPITKKTATGNAKTDRATLSALKEEHGLPLIDNIITFKKLHKLESSFLKNIKELRDPGTGRVHPSYLLIGTVTGRLSCKSPNLQQIPKYISLPDGSSINVKELFVAPKGRIFLYADYSQMEMVVMASMSAKFGDDSLKDAISNGLDLHCYVASKVFGIPYDEMFQKAKVDNDPAFVDLRSRAKTVGFAILYGSTAWGMSKKQGISIKESQKLIDEFFEAFPGIQKFVNNCHQMALKNKYVVSPFGRRRRFPITNVRKSLDGSSRRKAQNFPIQSTASDICLNSVITLTEEMPTIGGKVVVTVHDSLICEVDDTPEKIKEAAELMKDIMVDRPAKQYKFLEGVPLKADIEIGSNWGDTTPLTI